MNVKCIVNAGEFRQALDKVLKAATKKSRIPVLTEALVSFNSSTCTLTCTNLELWCQVSIPTSGEPCAFVLTDSRKLLTACKYFGGDLEFSYSKERLPERNSAKRDSYGVLTLRCGHKELRQRVLEAEDFPAPPEVEAEHVYQLDPATLSKRFERIKYALSGDWSRPCSCCVKFFDNRIGAVDGHRLAVSRDETLQVDAPFHIPPGAMKLLPIFNEADCRLLIGKRCGVFDSGSIQVITRIPEGDSLNFDAAIPAAYEEDLAVDIADFIDNLRYLNEFICYPGKEAIRFEGGALSVKTVSGEYRSKLELSSVPTTICGFNGGYMLDGLKQFQAKKLNSVAMQMSSPTAPIMLTDQDDLALILPMHLKNTA